MGQLEDLVRRLTVLEETVRNMGHRDNGGDGVVDDPMALTLESGAPPEPSGAASSSASGSGDTGDSFRLVYGGDV